MALKGLERERENLADGGGDGGKLVFCAGGEGETLARHLLGGSENVDGVVGDAFKVADGLQKLGRFLTFGAAHLLRAELDKIGAEDVFIVVAALLVVADALGELRRVGGERGEGVVQRAYGALGHLAGDGAALAQGKRGRGQQAFVKLGDDLNARIVGHDAAGELFEKTARGQEDRRAEQVERRVRDGDTVHRGGLIQERGGKHGAHDAEDREQHHNADDIEEKVHNGGALGVLVRADRGDHGRDGGADVLPHDDGDGRGVAHRAGDGKRLQNTDGRRARLDDGGEDRAGEHAEDGILEGNEKIRKGGDILKTGDGAAHRFHAEHERCKAEQDHAGVLFLAAAAEHIVDDADERKDGREGAWLQKLHPEVARVDAAEAQKPCRDRRADVRAHDDVDRLTQRHEAGVDKADHHDGGGGGTLDDGGDAKTREEARKYAARHPIEQGAELIARAALERLTHEIHAEEEERKSADHRQYIEDIHIFSFPFSHSFLTIIKNKFRLSNPQGKNCKIHVKSRRKKTSFAWRFSDKGRRGIIRQRTGGGERV